MIYIIEIISKLKEKKISLFFFKRSSVQIIKTSLIKFMPYSMILIIQWLSLFELKTQRKCEVLLKKKNPFTFLQE